MLNDYAWNTNGEIIACSDMPEYPTADEILALANHLYAFFTEHADSSEEYTGNVVVSSGEMTGNVYPVDTGNVTSV
jgi:hypothetical protein